MRGNSGTVSPVLLLDALGKRLELGSIDMEDPLEVGAHLSLHLVDLFEGIEVLADDTPRLVAVGVIAHYFGRDHKGGNKKAMPTRSSGSGETLFETSEEEKGGEHYHFGQTGPMYRVGDEMGQRRT